MDTEESVALHGMAFNYTNRIIAIIGFAFVCSFVFGCDQNGITNYQNQLATSKNETQSYDFSRAIEFKAVAWQTEELVSVVGDRTGSYDYLGCTVLIEKGSSCVIRGNDGTQVRWRMPDTMHQEALCYGFRNEQGRGLIIVKRVIYVNEHP